MNNSEALRGTYVTGSIPGEVVVFITALRYVRLVQQIVCTKEKQKTPKLAP